MNPLRWRDEHLLAWAIVTLLGAFVGFVVAWMSSPFYRIAMASGSSEPFHDWVASVGVAALWPMAVFGAVFAGAAYYAAMLIRVPLKGPATTNGAAKRTAKKRSQLEMF